MKALMSECSHFPCFGCAHWRRGEKSVKKKLWSVVENVELQVSQLMAVCRRQSSQKDHPKCWLSTERLKRLL